MDEPIRTCERAPAQYDCRVCDARFTPKRSDRVTTCSQRCGRVWSGWLRKATTRVRVVVHVARCRACSKQYVKRRQAQYCSDACRLTYNRQAARKYAEAASTRNYAERVCAECDATFSPVYGDKRRRFCSRTCSQRAGKRAAKRARRARERGSQVEPLDPLKVFERDGYKCQLCGKKTPKGYRGSYHMRAPELDHIVPLADGGEHTYRNTQTACRSCNRAKADGPGGQLRLFG